MTSGILNRGNTHGFHELYALFYAEKLKAELSGNIFLDFFLFFFHTSRQKEMMIFFFSSISQWN